MTESQGGRGLVCGWVLCPGVGKSPLCPLVRCRGAQLRWAWGPRETPPGCRLPAVSSPPRAAGSSAPLQAGPRTAALVWLQARHPCASRKRPAPESGHSAGPLPRERRL